MDTARIDVINDRLNWVYADDAVKPVHTPFHTIGKEIVDNLPSLDGHVLVLSDCGLLVSVLLKQRNADITFVAHTERQVEFARQVGVTKIIQVGYNNPIKELEDRLMGLKFDVVVGNPPYSEKAKASDKLWAKFVLSGFNVLTADGKLAFITPAGWVSPTNLAHEVVRDNLAYASFASSVSDCFGHVGGSQRFTYFILDKNATHCVCNFDEGEEKLNPASTHYPPQKSSSRYDYTIVSKLALSSFPVHSWKRIEQEDNSIGVVVPMAKSPAFNVQYGPDTFVGSRYKLLISKEVGENIAHNLNLKVYRQLRWVLRSGAALAGNFKSLPIPTTKMTDEELFDHIGMTALERKHINSK